jgi:hypothetical protein
VTPFNASASSCENEFPERKITFPDPDSPFPDDPAVAWKQQYSSSIIVLASTRIKESDAVCDPLIRQKAAEQVPLATSIAPAESVNSIRDTELGVPLVTIHRLNPAKVQSAI